MNTTVKTDPNQDDKVKMTPEMEALIKQQQDTMKQFQTDMQKSLLESQKAMQEAMTQSLSGIAETLKSGQQHKDDDSDNVSDDVESMSRMDFSKFLLSKVDEMFEKKLKPFNDQVSKLKDTTVKSSIQQAVKEFRSNTPDFDEWKEEMALAVKKNPNLTIDEAYAIARSGNNKKSREMDEKYKLGDFTEKEDSEEKTPKFGGMSPSNNGKTEERKKDMKSEEAADAAWEETFGNLQDLDSLANT